MNRLRSKLTYANVVSTLCLVLVVGGGSAYAASQVLPADSVGTAQLKSGAVTQTKLGDDVRDKLFGNVRARSVSQWIPSGDGELLEVECKPDEVAIGGAAGEGQGTPLGTIRSFTPGGTPLIRSESGEPVGWRSFGWNPPGQGSGLYEVTALCASR
jgi:hypothetical protein